MTLKDASISVALCTYNGDRFLQAQLDSLAAQTLLPSELVVCDDGSKDSTLEILERFARSAPFPVRIHGNELNLGYTRNFEKAISLCQGDFIALCDQDDLWYPHKLMTQVAILIEDPACGGVFSNGDLIAPDGARTTRSLWQSFHFTAQEQQRFSKGDYAFRLLRLNIVTGMTLVIRASLRDRLLPIPANWIHDGWLAWMIGIHSKLIACPKRLVAYRLHQSQQVGVPLTPRRKLRWVYENGLRTYFSRAKAKALADYKELAIQFASLGAHISSSKASLPSDLLTQVHQKQQFAEVAARSLAGPRRMRVGPVLTSIQSYRKYSPVPFRALFRDLVI